MAFAILLVTFVVIPGMLVIFLASNEITSSFVPQCLEDASIPSTDLIRMQYPSLCSVLPADKGMTLCSNDFALEGLVTENLDSYSLLERDLDAYGIEFSGMMSVPFLGVVAVLNSYELVEMDVDVSEYSDALNPALAPPQLILSVEEKMETLVAVDPLCLTEVLVEDVDGETFLDDIYEDIMQPVLSFCAAGTDFSTFFTERGLS